MSAMQPDVRFCTSLDGTRLAYAVIGSGPPLLVTPHNSLALDYELGDELGGAYFSALAERYTVIYYDARNVGLSTRTGNPSTLELDVDDIDAVATAVGLERFALYGSCQLAPAAAAYAARRPAHVSALVLWATVADGRRAFNEELQASILRMIENHWPMASRVVADMWAADEQGDFLDAMARALRESIDPSSTIARIRQSYETRIVELLPAIQAPVLVLHRQRDRLIPSSEAATVARLCRDAELHVFPGGAHWQWLGDTDLVLRTVFDFLERHPDSPAVARDPIDLTPRQSQVLALVARGMRNREIADELGLSVFTINRHVSSLLDRLDATSRTEAVHHARDAGLL
jgi:pimeloyl-ACP methyl ester carboxylesterase/DNA-binding CsgD family transcriptional regulator